MEDRAVEDEAYSDDDLDALPDHTFHELQENAFSSTQQPIARPQLPALRQPPRHDAPALAGGFGRLALAGASAHAGNPHEFQPPSSDYGDFDDEMLDGEIFDAAIDERVGETTQREHWRQQRYGLPPPDSRRPEQHTRQQRAAHMPGPNVAIPNAKYSDVQIRGPVQYDTRNSISEPFQGVADVEALQAEVQKLLREREALQKAIQDANDDAHAKAGEIAIVRANATKVEKEYENRTQSLQKLHADEAARQKIEVEKAQAELQKIATEKDFLENDLAEGTKQIRNLQRAIKKGAEKVTDRDNQLNTPKKSKALPFRDGFEDDEVQPLSPSKLALRSKATTPKGGTKRKRKPTEDSPVKALDLTEPGGDGSFEPVAQASNTVPPVVAITSKRPDQRFELTQQLLDHKFRPSQPRTFERLATYAFPSKSDAPLSTLLLDKMSALTFQPNPESFPAAISLVIISLWSQCIQEAYHEPVHLLVDLVKFILELNPLKTAPDLINEVMSLVQSTADIILVPRCKKQPPRTDRADVNCSECLQIIQMMAYDCQCDDQEIIRFWRTMRFDFIMMLLNFVNPLDEIHILLDILHTSILKQSFAMIVPPNNGQQDASEAHIIDNLSHLLINNPRPLADEDPPDGAEICNLRLEVLSLIEAMCETTHSAEALAKHRLVIGCLVRVMNDELDRVYDYQYGHEQRIALVNTATRLLYHLTTNYPHLINMQAKLSVIPGGEKKFLIVLTRLAFSEGGFYEQGIEDDVVDCAHQMLEARVSPEEAEQLVEAFSSAPVSRK
ncbi:hypothetical protein JMJ35_010020 [Cladonia borealis]|uniref:DNA repair protein Rad26 n=1 Tax=Cladonia borealis TaxID=184061 RepID=A0AA39QQV1_9LECA|nr:hypothetical protein JMJ35_010020 [Cladonia borealis]